MTAATLERRLANYRAALPRRGDPSATSGDPAAARGRALALAEQLAAALDGEIVRTPAGAIVRCEAPARPLAVDRDRLASLPGQPPRHVPLVCLDTETTGLATAAGTVVFLVGLGWWEGERFRQVQLLLPDHADEPALLTELAARIPPDAWLVTYNGRGFDWPLLVARYRLARRVPPIHAGHLDLLPIVRRVFRHRMTDARLRTVETSLLGLHRHHDVDGWEIPGRYLDFLRSGRAEPLVDVVRHNDADVRSLAWLLAHLETGYGSADRRASAPPGDLAGIARSFARDGRLDDALECLDAALASDWPTGPDGRIAAGPPAEQATRFAPQPDDDGPWWSPRRRPDFGGRPSPRVAETVWQAVTRTRLPEPWTDERLLLERARILRGLGRYGEAESAWLALAAAGRTIGILAWIEVAKVREHRLGDLDGALAATAAAEGLLARRWRLGRPEPRLDRELNRRRGRLESRLERRRRALDLGPRIGPLAQGAS